VASMQAQKDVPKSVKAFAASASVPEAARLTEHAPKPNS